MSNEPLVLDSVTHLTEQHRGAAAHCASHGGVYAGYFAAKMGIGAVILNDAGIGREAAGLAGARYRMVQRTGGRGRVIALDSRL